jgi:hypothetical protein
MYFDGRIQLAWLDIATAYGIVGLSSGTGTSVQSFPSLTIEDATLTEGNDGGQLLEFTVRLSELSTEDVYVRCFTNDNTAHAGTDYLAIDQTLMIPAGLDQAVVEIEVYGDTDIEANETFHVLLADPIYATILDGQAIGTIMNDDIVLLIPPFEQFAYKNDPFDLDNTAIMFTPNTMGEYDMSISTIQTLPTHPWSGQPLNMQDDDSLRVDLTSGQTVSLYGISYDHLYIGSNGYITFTEPDMDFDESWRDHFDTARISALFNDLNPGYSGDIYFEQLPDRVVVTWADVPEYGQYNGNTFQVEMYFDGRIQLAWLDITVTRGVVGLSPGYGLLPGYHETDLSQ